MRTPAAPSGITTIVSVIRIASAPAAASCSASRARTGRKRRPASGPTSAAASPPPLPPSNRRSCVARKTSYATKAPALPKRPTPRTIKRYFKASIELLPSVSFPAFLMHCGGVVTGFAAACCGPGNLRAQAWVIPCPCSKHVLAIGGVGARQLRRAASEVRARSKRSEERRVGKEGRYGWGAAGGRKKGEGGGGRARV